LQAAFEHEVSWPNSRRAWSEVFTPCAISSRVETSLHASRHRRLAPVFAVTVSVSPRPRAFVGRIVRYRFERQNRHHPFFGDGGLPSMTLPPRPCTDQHNRRRNQQPTSPAWRWHLPRVDRRRPGRQVGEVDAVDRRPIGSVPWDPFAASAGSTAPNPSLILGFTSRGGTGRLFEDRGNQIGRADQISERSLAPCSISYKHSARRPHIRGGAPSGFWPLTCSGRPCKAASPRSE